MTDERVKLLENIGFIWDSHAAAWEEKLNELKDYAKKIGDWYVLFHILLTTCFMNDKYSICFSHTNYTT